MSAMLAPALAPAAFPRLGALPDSLAIEVTARDIRDGRPGSGGGCAIALAVEHALWMMGVHYVSVTVSHADVCVALSWDAEYVDFWHNGRDFISRFDNGLTVAPFVLTLTRMRRQAAA